MKESSINADIIFIGSGINSLVCAALLAKKGKSVLVLERNGDFGGCIKTEQLFDGYHIDIMSTWYPLFVSSPGYAELKDSLEEKGLEFVQNDYSTGVVFPDGSGIALKNDIDDTANRLDAICAGDGRSFAEMANQLFGKDAALTFGLLSHSPYSPKLLKILFLEWWKRGLEGLIEFVGHALESCRRWATRSFQHRHTRALIAPWVLHTGLGPDDASSALIGKLTFAAVVAGGMPVVKGGSKKVVDALTAIIEEHGGTLINHSNVNEIVFANEGKSRKAEGVVASQTFYKANEHIVCNVAPNQLYGQLTNNPIQPPTSISNKAKGYQFGRGGMQIHFALSAPAPWKDPELLQVPLVHLTESMEQVCLSVTEANNGMLPSKPTLGIGQPTAVDPSRAPKGGWILWVQMQELPTVIKGDALGEIEPPEDGQWTDSIREAVAQRVQERLEMVMPGLSDIIVGRKSYSPADLEKMNCNLVGGDPYSGICSPDQFFWLRPFAPVKKAKAHQTPFPNVHHIGASTHPGPGLGATSGYIVAKKLTKKRWF
ncbi:transmembrane protein [Vibrio nigripulchritudo ATCC 27043]|uniref:phytoene desaturase family protein n=1 Tax=Vibrio nigripulchritudo TaxID=28173 RepID=UPI00021C31A8|nr:NAD(P)/FAD-dependent oxidoreductase [Vibrio nigripulchritudo]EGU56158.1 transmembrane protein [Vibrio nigripulchritudo ATCC 27043]